MSVNVIVQQETDVEDVANTAKAELQQAREEADKARKKAEELAQFPLYDPSPLIRYDIDNRKLLFVNPAAFNRYSDIFRKGAEHPLLADIEDYAAKAFLERRTISREVTVGDVTYQQAITPNLLGQEKIITVYSHDISRLKQIEEILRKETARAEAASRAKSDFLANMSHELRTPMNGVLGMASLLRDTAMSSEQKELVETIFNSGEALLMLLNDILDLSKIEANELTLESAPFNLHQLMSDTVRLFDPLFRSKKLRLDYRYNLATPECVIGDSARIRQIVTNLLGNALKFTEQGYVLLDITSRGTADGKTVLLLRVDDTGIGIKSQNLDKIFNKFTQEDESTTRRFGGTGLGLTICKLLAEAMKGRVGVESVFGRGSSFWLEVTLPIANLEQAERLSNDLERKNIMSAETVKKISDKRILVVDDHPVNLFFAKKLLHKIGFHHIDTADDGVRALNAFTQAQYDLVILDCQMPGMDGYEVSRKIRAGEQGTDRHVPIIAMTANAMVGDKEKCVDAGMDDYVTKPISGDRMSEVLVKWLDGASITIAEAANDSAAVQADGAVSRVKQIVPGDGAPVDMSRIAEYIGDDADEKSMVINLFVQGAEESLLVMSQNISDGENDNWKRAAHKLKGAASNFGANYLHDCCAQAEQLSDASAVDKAQLLHMAQQAYESAKNYLESLK